MPQQKRERIFKSKVWQQCYEDFLHAAENRSGSKRTPEHYHSVLKHFFCDPARTPESYSRPEVEAFLQQPLASGHWRVSEHISPSTYNLRLCALRSFYNYAAQYDVPYRNTHRPLLHTPSPVRSLHYLDANTSVPREISAQDFRAIIAAIPRDTVRGLRDRAIILCYFWTARRRNELASLRWGNLEEYYGVCYYTFVRKGKARQVDRAELPAPAWAAIKEYLVADGRWDTMQPDDAIFVDHSHVSRRDQAISGPRINRILKFYAKQVGMDVHLHDLRHMAAQERYEQNGHDILKIQELLRHENLNTTWIYLRRTRRKRDTDAEKLIGQFGDL